VCGSYEADIADLEAEVIRDVHLPTSYLHHRLSVYQTVLPALHHVVEKVLEQEWRGARIMELLYQEAQSGNTQVRHDREVKTAPVGSTCMAQFRVFPCCCLRCAT
jgi:hypothetical protein